MLQIDLTDKTAIVTGASQGLGACTAGLLAQAGANVVINYLQDPEGSNQRRARVVAEGIGPRAVTIEADVRNPQSVAALFKKTVEHFQEVHIVINNAGIIRDRTAKKMSDTDWQAVLDTNLSGTFNVCREAAQKLADGGRIVNLSSISSVLGFFGQTNYAAAKAGVVGLSKALSRELAGRGITVNAVAPGVILTEMGLTIPETVSVSVGRVVSKSGFSWVMQPGRPAAMSRNSWQITPWGRL